MKTTSRISTPSKSLVRRAATALATTALAAGLAVSVPATAQADANVSVGCQSNGTVHFSPGAQIVPLPQQIGLVGEGMCSDSSGMGIKSAKLSANFHDVWFGCLTSIPHTGGGGGKIEWTLDDGTVLTSQVNLGVDFSGPSVAKLSGHVTKGRFAGQDVSAQFKANLWQGVGDCTVGAPTGGVKDAAVTGHFTVN